MRSLLVARSYARDRTKSNSTIRMPLHPTLATMLRAWLGEGFEQMFGRPLASDDFVVPRPPHCRSKFGPSRDEKYVRTHLLKDLETLGLRCRRTHDLRQSFISHAQQDGAQPHVLIRLTHPSAKKATAFAGYTEFSWVDFCTEVAKLNVEAPRAAYDQHQLVAAAVGGGNGATSARMPSTPLASPSSAARYTPRYNQRKTPGKSWGSVVEAPGVENGYERTMDGGLRPFDGTPSTDSVACTPSTSFDVDRTNSSSPLSCNGCSKLREQVELALTELARGRLDLARARLEIVCDALRERADGDLSEGLGHWPTERH